MSNQLRAAARQLMGRPVIVRQTNGQLSRGVLRQQNDRGLYLEPTASAGYAAAMKQKANIETAIATEADELQGEEVFFAWWLILWALIAGIAAASAASYGAYGYGAPYGYGVRRPYAPVYRRYGPGYW